MSDIGSGAQHQVQRDMFYALTGLEVPAAWRDDEGLPCLSAEQLAFLVGVESVDSVEAELDALERVGLAERRVGGRLRATRAARHVAELIGHRV